MNEASPFSDPTTGPENSRLPGSINTLTILTFIGCGVAFLFTVYGFFTLEKSYEESMRMINSGDIDKMPDFVKKMLDPKAMEMMQKQIENKIPIFGVGMLGLALCTYGAILMRKLQKQGYYLWLLGNIVPLITSVILLGTESLTTNIFSVIILVIEVIFAILYAMQLKYMK